MIVKKDLKAKMIELMELLKIQVLIQKELMEKQKRKFVFIYNKIVRQPIRNKILIYIHLIFDDKAYEIDHIIPISVSLDDSLI